MIVYVRPGTKQNDRKDTIKAIELILSPFTELFSVSIYNIAAKERKCFANGNNWEWYNPLNGSSGDGPKKAILTYDQKEIFILQWSSDSEGVKYELEIHQPGNETMCALETLCCLGCVTVQTDLGTHIGANAEKFIHRMISKKR